MRGCSKESLILAIKFLKLTPEKRKEIWAILKPKSREDMKCE